MTRIKIRELIWDKYNVEHIKKHNVTVKEAEGAVKNYIAHKRGKKGRYIAVGRSGTKLISLVVKRVSSGVYYPVSVRDSSKKERREIYEKEKI